MNYHEKKENRVPFQWTKTRLAECNANLYHASRVWEQDREGEGARPVKRGRGLNSTTIQYYQMLLTRGGGRRHAPGFVEVWKLYLWSQRCEGESSPVAHRFFNTIAVWTFQYEEKKWRGDRESYSPALCCQEMWIFFWHIFRWLKWCDYLCPVQRKSNLETYKQCTAINGQRWAIM